VASFLVAGALICASAVGIHRDQQRGSPSTSLPLAVGAVGIGLAGAGLFTTDVAGVEPDRISTDRRELSTEGAIHIAFSVPVFLGLPLACILGASRFRANGHTACGRTSTATAIVCLSAITLAGSGFSENNGLTQNAGLFQRIAIAGGLGWLSLFAAWLRLRST
jgi:Protein of unknown function (DUF998)